MNATIFKCHDALLLRFQITDDRQAQQKRHYSASVSLVAAFSRDAGVLGIAPPTPKSNVSMRPQSKQPLKTMQPHNRHA